MALSSSSLQRVLWLVSLLTIITKAMASEGANPMSHPVGGDVIPLGQPYTIIWTPGTPGFVGITLFAQVTPNEDGIASAIPGRLPNNGSVVWTPGPDDVADYGFTDYFLQICEATEDTSDYDCTFTSGGYFTFTNDTSGASNPSLSTTSASASLTSETTSFPTSSSSPRTETPTTDTTQSSSAASTLAPTSTLASSPTSSTSPTPTNASMILRKYDLLTTAVITIAITVLLSMGDVL